MKLIHTVLKTIIASSLMSNVMLWPKAMATEQASAIAQTNYYCQLSPGQVAQKEQLRKAALAGDRNSQKLYADILLEHSREVGNCRMRTWPRTQAIWLRFYPCDAKPGEVERLLDDIVNRGYNEVYIEVFYDGQVLLPVNQNPTVWPSVIRSRGYENLDLLGESIKQAKMRGLRAYAWSFTMNFGYTYSQIREEALARNGQGQTTLTVLQDAGIHDQAGESHANHAFIDPYSPIARQDYQTMINAMLQRRPDGMLFDYVRYLRGVGKNSIVDNVKDLWIYGDASQEAILKRAYNQKGQELIRRYLKQGFLTDNDLSATNRLYPQQTFPLWQGHNAFTAPIASTEIPRSGLLEQLWLFSVAHATQGILDFVDQAIAPVEQRGLKAGAVFFPEGNRPIRGGFDSRLQPWEQFPASMEFHPMSYAKCGDTNVDCITTQVERVIKMAPSGVKIVPALAGVWGQPFKSRPSLEVQMRAIREKTPQINAISHFSYDWQEPDGGNSRKFCRL